MTTAQVPSEIELITASTALYGAALETILEAKQLEDATNGCPDEAKDARLRAAQIQTVVRYLDAIRLSTYG